MFYQAACIALFLVLGRSISAGTGYAPIQDADIQPRNDTNLIVQDDRTMPRSGTVTNHSFSVEHLDAPHDRDFYRLSTP